MIAASASLALFSLSLFLTTCFASFRFACCFLPHAVVALTGAVAVQKAQDGHLQAERCALREARARCAGLPGRVGCHGPVPPEMAQPSWPRRQKARRGRWCRREWGCRGLTCEAAFRFARRCWHAIRQHGSHRGGAKLARRQATRAIGGGARERSASGCPPAAQCCLCFWRRLSCKFLSWRQTGERVGTPQTTFIRRSFASECVDREGSRWGSSVWKEILRRRNRQISCYDSGHQCSRLLRGRCDF